MEKETLFQTTMGDTVLRYSDAIVLQFNGNRNVASTSALNGGARSDLKFAFNKSCGRELHGKTCPGLKGATHVEHFATIAGELGLVADESTGMGTAALVENMAVVSESYNELSVTAMVTAGVDVNGGRAGDVARYDELTKQHINISPSSGTINMFLLINANVPDGTLTRAIVTATEAKSVALQELMANSMYSTGLATGSGTDSTIAVGNLDSPIYLENAGKHCKLGELIGTAVIKAVKDALDRQSGMNIVRQSSVLWQNKRYGITADKIWMYYTHIFGAESLSRELFDVNLANCDRNKTVVAYMASAVHLIDQYSWGLLDENAVHDVVGAQIKAFRAAFGLPELKGHSSDSHKNMPPRSFQDKMISPLIATMAYLCHKS